MKKKFYITTAIAYPNSAPHLGHALEIIQADVVARFHRLLGKDVFFQTGTDEHGVKNWQTAQKEGKDIMKFLDANVAVFKELYKKLNISYDYFIRTTDKKIHYPGAIKLWKELVKSGDIYRKHYKGSYCSGCEAFKTEKELENGKCPNHPTSDIEIVKEENYFFKLSKYREDVIKKIKSDNYKVIPETRKNEILSFLKAAEDISFSRPKTTLPWGIPVPGDDRQIMYVWCDALSNYITGVGYGRDNQKFKQIWPADIHIIGKDILRFHAAFWPAMLISAKVPLPKQLFVHGFILSRGAKMSKSTGNIIEPFGQMETYGVDQFRFYIMEAMPVSGDGEYSEDLVAEKINSELVGNLSNFCYRVLSFTNKNFDSGIKKLTDDPIINKITAKFDEIKKAYEEFDFKKAIDKIMVVSSLGNKYFQDNEPWKLVKLPNESEEGLENSKNFLKEDKDKAHKIVGLCVNMVKNLSILIQPVMPGFSAELQKQLNLKNLKWKDVNFNLKNHKIAKAKILIKKSEKREKKQEEMPQVEYEVDDKVKDLGLKFYVAQINDIDIKKKNSGLEKLKKEIENRFKEIDLKDNKIYLESKKLYKNKNFEPPYFYLINLTKEKGKLPNINTVVDSYNLVSVKYLVSVGAHDISKIKGKVRFKITDGSEKYIPLGGKDIEKIESGEYACVDDEHVLCRLDIKQSEFTKVDNKTKSIMVYVQGNKENKDYDLRNGLKEICENIVKFCGGNYRILEQISLEEKFPLNLKVAEITSVEDHPKAEKLYVLKVDLGTEKRQLVAGLKIYYRKEDLLDKKIIVVTNLKHAKLRGVESQGMLLAGDDKENVGIVYAENSAPGDNAFFNDLKNSSREIIFENFSKINMVVKNNKVCYKDKILKTGKEDIKVEKVKDKAIVR